MMSSPRFSLIVPQSNDNISHKLKKKHRTRRVQISPTAQLNVTTPINRSWYTQSDEQQCKLNARYEMLIYLRNKKAAEAAGKPYDVLCPVGLEMKLLLISNNSTKKRVLARKIVKAAVLMEQARVMSQYEHEYVRQERIAAASMRHSEWSRSQALSIGTFQNIAARID